MTNAEAIKNLEYLKENFTREGGTMCQAVDMAIEALTDRIREDRSWVAAALGLQTTDKED